jgi:hypothetical protein
MAVQAKKGQRPHEHMQSNRQLRQINAHLTSCMVLVQRRNISNSMHVHTPAKVGESTC